MRRDRTGDVLDADDVTEHRCAAGWTGETADGRPTPCPTCRPHLVRVGSRLTARQPIGTALTERQWQQQVVDLARLRGWRHFHAYSSQKSTPGWPDLALVRSGRFVVAELKTATGRVRPEQRQWLDDLTACPGVEAHLWRPSDWPTVQQVLA